MRGKCGGHGLTLKRIEIKFQVQVWPILYCWLILKSHSDTESPPITIDCTIIVGFSFKANWRKPGMDRSHCIFCSSVLSSVFFSAIESLTSGAILFGAPASKLATSTTPRIPIKLRPDFHGQPDSLHCRFAIPWYPGCRAGVNIHACTASRPQPHTNARVVFLLLPPLAFLYFR